MWGKKSLKYNVGLLSLVLSIFFSIFVLAQLSENDGPTLSVSVSDSKWVITKYTGTEAEDFRVWTANAKDKKTEIGFIVKEGKTPDLSPRKLINESGSFIQDDKNKDIILKHETSKCDGQDCYHISLTTAQAININNYIQLGQSTIIIEYQNTSLINYQSDWFDLNVTLFIDLDGDWNNTVNNIFVFDNPNKKFGANVSNYNTTQHFKYQLESDTELNKGKGLIYYLEKLTPTKCGSVACVNSEKHKIDFADICRLRINETAILFNPNCKFNQIDSFNLEVEFDAEYNSTLDIIPIDPTITIDDVNSYTPTVRNNVTSEAYPLTHGTLNDSSLVLYLPFDVQNKSDGVTHDYSGNNNDGVLDNDVRWNATGFIGGAFEFLADNEHIEVGSSSSLDDLNNTGMTIMLWVRPRDSFGETASTNAFVSKNEVTDTAGRWSFGVFNDGTVVFSKDFTTTALIARTGTTLTANVWTHVAMTWTGGFDASEDIAFFFDGGNTTRLSSTDGVGDIISDAGIQIIIGSTLFLGRTINGTLDELMIFNRSLSAVEINDTFKNQSFRFITPASQLFENINISQNGTFNRVNVTTNSTITNFGNNGTNITLRLIGFNSTGVNIENSSYFNITTGDNQVQNFSINTNVTNLTLEFLFICDENNFYCSILRDNIDILSWNTVEVAGAANSVKVTESLIITSIEISTTNNVRTGIISLVITSITDVFNNLFRTASNQLSFNSLTNRFLTIPRNIVQQLSITSIIDRFPTFVTSLLNQLSFNSILDTLSSFFRIPAQQLSITPITDAFGNLFRTASNQLSFNSFANRLLTIPRNVVQQLSITSIVDRTALLFRSSTQSFNIFISIISTSDAVPPITPDTGGGGGASPPLVEEDIGLIQAIGIAPGITEEIEEGISLTLKLIVWFIGIFIILIVGLISDILRIEKRIGVGVQLLIISVAIILVFITGRVFFVIIT